MAGGKMSPRQRMINLMYLVFIAMLALNMSKEVLSAFGLMNEKFEDSNTSQVKKNTAMLDGLKTKASSDAGHFADSYAKSQNVAALSNEFYAYLEELKKSITVHFKNEEGEDHPSYEQMDKSTIDEEWIGGKGITKKGEEILAAFKTYREGMLAVLENPGLKDQVESKFATKDEKDKDGNKVPYLQYHFAGFPAIATVAKLSALQNDIKSIEAAVYANSLGSAALEMAAVNENNYKAIVVPDKTAFFAGETFTGKVILARYDDTTVPTSVTVNGKDYDMNTDVENGAVNLKFATGNVGEHKINGKFVFNDGEKDSEIAIEGNYVVVPKPNSATISADKMNVVYRGVENPMTISFAGVDASNTLATAPGLQKTGTSSYVVKPMAGKELKINVTGTLPDGSKVSDSKTFRIKDLPKPLGSMFNMEGDVINLPANSVSVGKVEAGYGPDFDFQLPLTVQSFVLAVPGQAPLPVQGSTMSPQAQAAIKKAKRGDIIRIFEIKAKAPSVPQLKIPTVSPITIEVQ